MIDSWIDVEDRLPDVDNKKYLVWVVSHYPPVVNIGKWRYETWFLQGLLLDSHEFTVTHWQPMPTEPLNCGLLKEAEE